MNYEKRRKYKKDFLDNVIVRIDFDTPLPIEKNGPSEKIYSTVKNRFPITEEKKLIGRKFLLSGEIKDNGGIEMNEWLYYGKNREKRLIISPNMMSINYNEYEYYEMLKEDFFSVVEALYNDYPNLQIKRLGLRYIDKIFIPNEDIPVEWDKYIKPELNTIFKFATDLNTIARAFHVLEFNYGEDFLRFQFGMFNPDYPAVIKKKEYVLDHDMYTNKLLNRFELEEKLDFFHKKVNKSFEKIITDELRKIMEPIDE